MGFRALARFIATRPRLVVNSRPRLGECASIDGAECQFAIAAWRLLKYGDAKYRLRFRAAMTVATHSV
jgi:hypothetical protein